jgi:hypothetical protein
LKDNQTWSVKREKEELWDVRWEPENGTLSEVNKKNKGKDLTIPKIKFFLILEAMVSNRAKIRQYEISKGNG